MVGLTSESKVYIKSIAEKLTKMGITKVISIDDEWHKVVSDEGLYNHINDQVYNNMIEDLENVSDISMDFKDAIRTQYPSLSDFNTALRDGEVNQEILEYFNRELKCIYEVQDLRNLKALFEKVKEENNDIDFNYFNDFDAYELSELKDINNTLFIFDILQDEGGSLNSKLNDRLKKIALNNQAKNILVIFYSHSTDDIEKISSYHKRKEYIMSQFSEESKENHLSMLYNLCSFKKTPDINKLIINIMHIIFEASYGNGVLGFLKYHRNAMIDASDSLIEINFLETDHFFSTSYFEGDCIVDQYSREIEATVNQLLGKNLTTLIESNSLICMRDYEHLKLEEFERELLNSIKDEDNAYKKTMEKSKKTTIKNSLLSRAYLQVADYNINALLSDPSIGDVFVLDDGTDDQKKLLFGILVSQECNNVIRNLDRNSISSEPNRVNSRFELLLFNGKKIKNSNNNSVNDYENKLFPIKIRGEYYQLEANYELLKIPTFIIDACSLNRDGQALYNENINHTITNYKKFHSKKYYSLSYKKYIKDYVDDLHHCLVEVEDAKVKNNLLNTLVIKDLGITFIDNKFGVNRICRVKKEIAYYLLQNYVNKLFKIARKLVNNEDLQSSNF